MDYSNCLGFPPDIYTSVSYLLSLFFYHDTAYITLASCVGPRRALGHHDAERYGRRPLP